MLSIQPSSTLCGALVEFEGRQATIGLTLDIDGDIQALTVDHLFRNDILDQELPSLSDTKPGMSGRSEGSSTATSVKEDLDDAWYNDSDDDDASAGHDSGLDVDDNDILDDWLEEPSATLPEHLASHTHGEAKIRRF